MLRSVALVHVLSVLCYCSPQCPQGEEGSCTDDQGSAGTNNKGLTLLQGTRKASKIETDVGCAGDNEDPNWPRRNRGCCSGLQRCGPYQFRWGWSYRCYAQCRAPLDECGCRIGVEGWSTTIQACRPQSTTSESEARQCQENRPTTTTTTTTATTTTTTTDSATTTGGGEVTTTAGSSTTGGTGGTGPTPVTLRVMAWNVYFANGRIDAMANMLREWDVDIANLQETNNRLDRIAEESGYVSANTWRRDHDWCGYNFHKADWRHEGSVEVEVPGARGVCGAMIQKGEAKFCVWGLHPIQHRNKVENAKESIRLAADKMKECAETHSAPSIFLGDFNTMDWRGAMGELEYRTGWKWSRAARHDIDFIFITESPLRVGQVKWEKIVGDGTCWPAFPPHAKVSEACGWADHSPIVAEIELSFTG